MGNRGSSLSDNPSQCTIFNTCTDHNLTNNIHGDRNRNVGNVSNSYNTINVGLDEESSRIQAWLSPLDPELRHRGISAGRMAGVGDWVLRRNEFEGWCRSQDGSGDPTLLCYGGQGVGKTFISSLVIDSLRKHTRGQNMVVLSLYCDYQTHKDQSAVNIIGSLLSQVALGAKQIPSEVQRAFELAQRGRHAPQLSNMAELFIKTVRSIERVYICFDAMDELLPQNLTELLRTLRQIIREAPNIRLFLTGRPHIRRELDNYLTKGANIIPIVVDQGDIERYLSREVEDDDVRCSGLMPDDLKHDILETMREKNSEMFLLVVLNIKAILGRTSVATRKEMLQKVAKTGVDLESVYTQTLQRIKEQEGDQSRLGMEVLMWISHAERPLTIGELCYALAVEVGKTDLNAENIRPRDIVLRSCLGLVVVDSGASTVRLIHYTLQEYLRHSDVLPAAHQTLARTCLAYLNYDHIKALPADKVPNLRDMPLLEYSSLYWGIHAKEGLSDDVKSLALDFLSRFDLHISSTLLFHRAYPRRYSMGFIAIPLFIGLHCASYFGIVEVMETLIETEGCDIDKQDSVGLTALTWAALNGMEGVVKLLLARDDVNPNKPADEGWTPLNWASSCGHGGVARLLLARDDINFDETSLYFASSGGHEEVVSILLANHHVNPDKPERGTLSSYSLMEASEYGYEGVVTLLLATGDVNPDEPHFGHTPLSVASKNGHEGVVSLLLARDDVNPDRPDITGDTPLILASSRGHEGVVRLLLATEYFNPGHPDKSGQMPLWWACLNGDEKMVRQLLAGNNVNANEPDRGGRTPLWWACLRGHEGVVKLLLARDDVNPGKPGSNGRTPLSLASMQGHEMVVRLLLERGDVNPDKQDNAHLRAALGDACRYGHEGVVRLLLARDDINPDHPDYGDFRPLQIACSWGQEGVVGLLLARDDINPNKLDERSQSPLWSACAFGHERIVRQLLARGDIKPDQLEDNGETPLWAACDSGYAGAVRLLLARDDVNPNKPNSWGVTPLETAFIHGHGEIVELLQARISAISSSEGA